MKTATLAPTGKSGLLLESKGGPQGSAWRVMLIQAGTSGNGIHYSPEVLARSVPLFEGVRAYADHPSRDEARSRPERSVRDVVGWYDHVAYDTARKGICADFHIVESADWLRLALKSAWDAGKPDLLGFSISAQGTKGQNRQEGGQVLESIDRVVSTDVVTTPGAGGRLIEILESLGRLPDVKKKTGANGAVIEDDEFDPQAFRESLLTEVRDVIREAVNAKPADDEDEEDDEVEAEEEAEEEDGDPVQEALREARATLLEVRQQNQIAAISTKIDGAKLPVVHAARVKARLLEALSRRAIEDAEIDAEISFVRDTIRESGRAGTASLGAYAVGDDGHDQMVKALHGWFKGEAVDGVSPVRDLRESYSLWENRSYLDADPFSMFRAFASRFDSGADHKRLQESLATTDWGQVFADVFYLQMISSYKASPDYDKWRLFVSDLENVPDFRTRHWARIGGYGDYSTIAEKGTYPVLTSPGDEEVTYAMLKYGGIDEISLEMILGDRLGQVRRMPQLMAYAASRTLYKFVLDMITTGNPTMDYDSVALYIAGHGNTGTTALSIAGVDAVRVAMRSQTAYGNSLEILGTRNTPKTLIVPNTLEGRAARILSPSDAYSYAIASPDDTGTTQDPQRFKGSGMGFHVYDQLTDVTDWWAVADPQMVPTMVMGFLNGRQEPELFTQDSPNVGSVFSADKVSYKLRFIFGGDVLDHRAFYRQVVSG